MCAESGNGVKCKDSEWKIKLIANEDGSDDEDGADGRRIKSERMRILRSSERVENVEE